MLTTCNRFARQIELARNSEVAMLIFDKAVEANMASISNSFSYIYISYLTLARHPCV